MHDLSGEENEARETRHLFKSVTAPMWQRQDLKPGPLMPEFLLLKAVYKALVK